MKKIILIPLLFTSVLVHSQCANVNFNLLSNLQTCDDKIELKLEVSSETKAPFQLFWSKNDLRGNFDRVSFTTSKNEESSVFSSDTVQNGNVTVKLIDANNCIIEKKTNLTFLKRVDENQEYFSISMPLNIQESKMIVENVVLKAEGNEYYYFKDGKSNLQKSEYQLYNFDTNSVISTQNSELGLSKAEVSNSKVLLVGDTKMYYQKGSDLVLNTFYSGQFKHMKIPNQIAIKQGLDLFEVYNFNGSLNRVFWIDDKSELYHAVLVVDEQKDTSYFYNQSFQKISSVNMPSDSIKFLTTDFTGKAYFINNSGEIFFTPFINGYEIKKIARLPVDIDVADVRQIHNYNFEKVLIVSAKGLSYFDFDTTKINEILPLSVEVNTNTGSKNHLKVMESRNVELFYVGADKNIHTLDLKDDKNPISKKLTEGYIKDNAENDLKIKGENIFYQTINGEYAIQQRYFYSNLNCFNLNGLFKDQVQNEIEIYPNPNNGVFSIDTNEKGVFVLFNSLGKKVLETEDFMEINTNHLTNGLYLYQFKTNKALYSGKIVKE